MAREANTKGFLFRPIPVSSCRWTPCPRVSTHVWLLGGSPIHSPQRSGREHTEKGSFPVAQGGHSYSCHTRGEDQSQWLLQPRAPKTLCISGMVAPSGPSNWGSIERKVPRTWN